MTTTTKKNYTYVPLMVVLRSLRMISVSLSPPSSSTTPRGLDLRLSVYPTSWALYATELSCLFTMFKYTRARAKTESKKYCQMLEP